MAGKKVTAPADKVVLYERLLESVGVDAKSNFGSAYTAVNGNMYTMISKHGVVGIRLPEPERSAFLKDYSTSLFRGDPAWPPAKESSLRYPMTCWPTPRRSSSTWSSASVTFRPSSPSRPGTRPKPIVEVQT